MEARRNRMVRAGMAFTCVMMGVCAAAQAAVPARVAKNSSAAASPGQALEQTVPLSENRTYILHDAAGSHEVFSSPLAAPPTDKLVYSNTRGTFLFRPGTQLAGTPVADDVTTSLVTDCDVPRFRVGVSGGVPGGGGTFNAFVRLFDACPGAGGTILGQTLFFGLNDDETITHILDLDSSNSSFLPIVAPPDLYVEVAFSTTEAGWIYGALPDVGFSADSFFNGKVNSCTATFGGCGNGVVPCANFFSEVYADVACEVSFLAYQAVSFDPTRAPSITNGVNNRLADDLILALPPNQLCTLATYSIGISSGGGTFQLDVDMRQFGTTSAIPGTQHTFTVNGTNGIQELLFRPDPNQNIVLPNPVHLTWKPNVGGVGGVVVGRSQAGSSNDIAWFLTPDPGNPNVDGFNWLPIGNPTQNRLVFFARVTCKGDPPLGACCPRQNPNVPDVACTTNSDCPEGRTCDPVSCQVDADCPQGTCVTATGVCSQLMCSQVVCLDDVPVSACVPVNGRWVASQTCASNPFNPPCGTHACCTPPTVKVCNLSRDIVCTTNVDCPQGEFCASLADCEDLTSDVCAALTDPTGPVVLCTANSDCLGGTTCQPNGVCTPRAGVWSPGKFCGVDNFSCPVYECFFGKTDCFDAQPEIICSSGTGVDKPCTGSPCLFDSQCPPPETCVTSIGRCTSQQCGGRACLASGVCEEPFPDDSLCPSGQRCLPFPQLVCEQPRGCNNIRCCDAVCRIPQFGSFCCDTAWDSSCTQLAQSVCTLLIGNDECSSRRCSVSTAACTVDGDCPKADDVCQLDPNLGAIEIMIPTSGANAGFASISADNGTATSSGPNATLSDPPFCCSKRGPAFTGGGTIWYKFVMPSGLGSSAKISTCSTAGPNLNDSILQLYSTTGSCSITTSQTCTIDTDCPSGETCLNDLETQCGNLTTIACSDDKVGCGDGTRSEICVGGLVPGQTYFLELASTSVGLDDNQQGNFTLDIKIPCNVTLPANDRCDAALPAPFGTNVTTSFDLNNATIDCPAEPCVTEMTNDVWFSYVAACTGNLTVDTCASPPGINNPDTTLAVYSVLDPFNACPPGPGDLLGCNNDAVIDAAGAALRPQRCGSSGTCSVTTSTLCTFDSDCPSGETCNSTSCDTGADCASQCSTSGTVCTTSADCNSCTNTGASCLVDGDCLTCFNGERCVNGTTFSGGSGTACTVNADCTVSGEVCSAQCAVDTDCPPNTNDFCIPGLETCTLSGESCVSAPCVGSCGIGSSITVPVSGGQNINIRVGGETGSEPSGTVTISCVQDDCQPNGLPDVIDIQVGISQDTNMNGIPDECEGPPPIGCMDITGSSPTSCEIDAGKPFDRTDSTMCNMAPGLCGWTSIDLMFNTACNRALTAADFTIRTVPGNIAPPAIAGVVNNGATATVNFSGPIPPNEWTCVTFTPLGIEKCLGFLPGDVNASLGSNAQDITALINSLNNVVLRPIFATDVNRSGPPANAQDITSEINLLNGAGMFSPWNGQTISTTCPSP